MTAIDLSAAGAPLPALSVPARPAALPAVIAVRPASDRRPAAVYLARLAMGSRPTMGRALDVVVSIISAGRDDAGTLDCAALRYQHTQAVRAVLAERHALANANKGIVKLTEEMLNLW